MCGIAGIIAFAGTEVSKLHLDAMVNSLEHRGPDARGSYIFGNVGLGHTRLSIIDLSAAGQQPMHSKCGRYTLIYNGEIYNAKELSGNLSDISMRGHSDTEVLLESLIRYGSAVISELNGMFAFAFYDQKDGTLLIARDRFGIKPLYFIEEGDEFRFGSEIKCLFAGTGDNRKIRKSAIHEFFYYGVTLGTQTFLENVDRLLPGHIMTLNVRTGKSTLSCFVPNRKTKSCDISEDPKNKVLNLLEASVKRHLISDVPVAVFLSGGIDSSAVTAFAAKHSPERLKTYSVGFDIPGGVDELPIARLVAKRFKTDHQELHISVNDVQSVLSRLCNAHDVPFGDAANIPLYLLCEELAGSVKVVLQGDGGDEIFGGYTRYRWLYFSKIIRWFCALSYLVPFGILPNDLELRIKRVLDAFSNEDAMTMALLLTEETLDRPPIRVLSEELQNEVKENDPFSRYFQVCNASSETNLAQRMLHTDTQIILPDVFLEKVDRSTMAHSIEVRVPFLDTELTDFVTRLPVSVKMPYGQQKGLLKTALRGVLPDRVLDRRKTGFSVPYKEWLRGSLGDWLLDLIDCKAVQESGLLDTAKVRQLLSNHRKGNGRDGFLLYKLLVLAIWINNTRATL